MEIKFELDTDKACSHTKTKVVATNTCGNTQLCAGLRSGIEANLHAV